MKIPKKIEKLIERRRKLAEELNSVSLTLDNWIEEHGGFLAVCDDCMDECMNIDIQNLADDMEDISDQYRNMVYNAYSDAQDITFIMQDTINVRTDNCISTEVIGFYYGEPNREDNRKFSGKLKAEFAMEEE